MQHPSSAGSPLPPRLAAPSVSPQVWLCHHAEVAQQGDSGEAVGAALDQELPVWGAVEEDAPQLLLSPSQVQWGPRAARGSLHRGFGTREWQLLSLMLEKLLLLILG